MRPAADPAAGRAVAGRPFGTIARDAATRPSTATPGSRSSPPPRSAAASSSSSRSAATPLVPSASLVPAGDQTLLFTNSGMVQFKDVLTGAETRSYTRAVDYQRCLRVAGKHNDFEEVGRTPRHHTLFEMLGNWSFGDYFKREAIHWAWDFLTRRPRDPGRPAGGDDLHGRRGRPGASGATRSACRPSAWRAGATSTTATTTTSGGWPTPGRAGRAARSTSTAARTCPRAPSASRTTREQLPALARDLEPRVHGVRPAARRPRRRCRSRASTPGMGLERLAERPPAGPDRTTTRTCSRRSTPGCASCSATTRTRFEAERFSYQVIADHSRAVTFLIADDVLPSNEGRGYVLRRILRRAVRHGRLLGRREPFLAETAAVVIEVMGEAYPHLVERRDGDPRRRSPARRPSSPGRSMPGTRLLEEALSRADRRGERVDRPPARGPARPTRRSSPGDVAFKLHDTYGFPIDLTVELAAEYGVGVDRAGFEAALAEQRERQPLGQEGRARAGTPSSTSLYGAIQARAGDTTFLGYETTTARGPRRRDPARRHRSSTS